MEVSRRTRPRRVRGLVSAVLAAAVISAAAGVASAAGPVVPPAAGSAALASSPDRETAAPVPRGQVASVTADGGVWLGDGANPPVRIAEAAALGAAGQAAVAVAPTADVVAYVRADGALVLVPVGGGVPSVIATDVVLTSLGREPSIAWNAAGDQIAYLARGTEAMVMPRSPTPPPLSSPEVFRVPLPQGVLGDVVQVVDRTGSQMNRIGDPSLRSYIGVTWSPGDDLMLLTSVIPGTDRRYTLVAATGTSTTETPTVVSADQPTFAPDGRAIFAVGPAKGFREIIGISTDNLSRRTLASAPAVCQPAVSPDGTRIAFGSGEDCSRLWLVSTAGGEPIDVTPAGSPDDARFGVAELGWSADGRFIVTPACRERGRAVECNGPSVFLDPDSGRVVAGPEATTTATVRRPLTQDVWVDVDLRGPLEFRASFVVDPAARGRLTDLGDGREVLEAELTDGTRELSLKMTLAAGSTFVNGSMTVVDPGAGVDRTLLVMGRANVVGVRVFSISGIWMTSEDLPWATGRFDVAIRRR
jgi:hypothetical protein